MLPRLFSRMDFALLKRPVLVTEMPRSCEDCPFAETLVLETQCLITGGDKNDCPLKLAKTEKKVSKRATPCYVLVHTHGLGYSPSENMDFKYELMRKYPEVTIECSDQRRDFCEYLLYVPSKAMARKLMWDLGRQKSLRTYWDKKFCAFEDSLTGESPNLYCGFFYKTKEERKKIDAEKEQNV